MKRREPALRTEGSGETVEYFGLFWEMGTPTAIRRGRHKLVIHGQLVEGERPTDEEFLVP